MLSCFALPRRPIALLPKHTCGQDRSCLLRLFACGGWREGRFRVVLLWFGCYFRFALLCFFSLIYRDLFCFFDFLLFTFFIYWFVLTWFGFRWFGLARLGLVWFGLIAYRSFCFVQFVSFWCQVFPFYSVNAFVLFFSVGAKAPPRSGIGGGRNRAA